MAGTQSDRLPDLASRWAQEVFGVENARALYRAAAGYGRARGDYGQPRASARTRRNGWATISSASSSRCSGGRSVLVDKGGTRRGARPRRAGRLVRDAHSRRRVCSVRGGDRAFEIVHRLRFGGRTRCVGVRRSADLRFRGRGERAIFRALEAQRQCASRRSDGDPQASAAASVTGRPTLLGARRLDRATMHAMPVSSRPPPR